MSQCDVTAQPQQPAHTCASFASLQPSHEALCAFMMCRAGRLPRCDVTRRVQPHTRDDGVDGVHTANSHNNNSNVDGDGNNSDSSSRGSGGDDDGRCVRGVAPYEYTGCDYALVLYSCVALRTGDVAADDDNNRDHAAHMAALRARVTALLASLCWSNTPLPRQLRDNVHLFCTAVKRTAALAAASRRATTATTAATTAAMCAATTPFALPRVVRDALRPSRLRCRAQCLLQHLQVQHWLYWLDACCNSCRNSSVSVGRGGDDSMATLSWSPYDTVRVRVHCRRRCTGLPLRLRTREPPSRPLRQCDVNAAEGDVTVMAHDDDDDDEAAFACVGLRACRSLSRATLLQHCVVAAATATSSSSSLSSSSSSYTPLAPCALTAATEPDDKNTTATTTTTTTATTSRGEKALQYARPWRHAMKTTTTRDAQTRAMTATSSSTRHATAASPALPSLHAQWCASQRAAGQLRRVLADVRAYVHHCVVHGEAADMSHCASRLRDAAQIATSLARDVP